MIDVNSKVLKEILLELTLVIGGETDYNKILKKTLPLYLRRLNCTVALVFHTDKGKVKSEFILPISLSKTKEWPTFREKVLEEIRSGKIGSLTELSENGLNYYLFSLNPEIFLILGRKEAFGDNVIDELIPVIQFLGQALNNAMEIQKRKFAEEELNKERLLLKTIIDHIPDSIYLKDLSLKKLVANKADLFFSGYDSESEILGKTDSEIYPPELADHATKVEKEILRTGLPMLNVEEFLENKKGFKAVLNTSKFPLIDENQNILGIVGIGKNITEFKNNQKEIKLLSLVASQTDSSVLITDLEGKIEWVNDGFIRLTGYTADEARGMRPWWLLRGPLSDETTLNEIVTDILLQKPIDKDIIIYNKKKEAVWINIQGSPLKDDDGNVQGFFSIQNDISERKKSEAQIRQLLTWIDESSDAMHVIDETGNIRFINTEAANRLGKTKEELIGQHIGTVEIMFQDHSKWEEHVAELKEVDQQILEGRHVRKDGHEYPVEVSAKYLNIENQGFVIAFTRDITERKRTELILRQSEEKYRGIMENMELGFLEVDLDGKIIRAHDQMCRMSGYTEAELIGKNAMEIFTPEEFKETLLRQDNDRLEGRVGNYEVQLRKKNGERLWVLISGGPVFDYDGNVVGSVGIHYDITEQKQFQEELAKAKNLAEKAQEAEKQFLSNMSHEIRTPLNAIIGMTNLLYDTKPTNEQIDYLDTLNSSANFLLSLISDILDIAKIESGKIELHPKPFNLSANLNTLRKTFKLKVGDKPVKIETHIDEKLNPAVIGDETLFNQVLMNLLSNSEKFTESGTIGLQAKLIEQDDPTVQWIEFKVYDTGIGISNDNLDAIFEKFKQIKSDTGQKYRGTGLGLAITKQLIVVMGGQIGVESKKGEGTTFTFQLPFKKYNSDLDQNHEFAQKSVKVIEKINQKADVRLDPLLVVEDNLTNQKYIRTVLSKFDIDFEIANDGKEALELTFQKKYSLILMDLQMPVMDGYESTISIRNSENINQHTIIIALTASALLDQKNKALSVGMNDFITKPFTPSQLKEKLEEYLGF